MFEEYPSNLVDQGRTLTDSQTSRPMEFLENLLIGTLHRDKAHVRPLHRFTDGLGIEIIVLVRFEVGFDELWAHQSNVVTAALAKTRPVVCAATGFHPNQAGFEASQKFY